MALAIKTRSAHWQDETGNPGQGAGVRRRRIKNHQNRQRSRDDHEMVPVSTDVEDGAYQVGPVTFAWRNQAALETYAGSTNVPGEAGIVALLHPRSGHNLLIRPIGGEAVPAVKLGSKRAVRLSDFYPDADLFWGVTPSGIRKVYRETTQQAALATRVVEVFPSIGEIVVEDNAARLVHKGRTLINFPRPYGWDSKDGGGVTGPGIESQMLEYEMTKVRDVTRWGRDGVRLRIKPIVASFVGATLPVFRDPTATVSGTTDLEDNMTYSNTAPVEARNYGGSTWGAIGGNDVSGKLGTLFRITSGSIPAGTITAMRLLLWRYSGAWSNGTSGASIYQIKDANDWVEGTATGAYEAGSSNWDAAKGGSQNWAGSQGCNTSGRDYFADASPPTMTWDAYTSGADYQVTVALVSSWATDWRDGGVAANGIAIHDTGSTDRKAFFYRATEAASNQPTAEIDYTESGALPQALKDIVE